MTRTHGTIRVRFGWIVALMMLTLWGVAGNAPATAAPDEVLGNRGVAERFFDDVLNAGDTAMTEALVSSSAVLRVPGGAFHGSGGCADLVAAVRASYPGAIFQVRDMIVDGDTVAVSWTLANIAGNSDAAPTVASSAASVDGIALLRIDNYLIVEVWMQ